MHTKITPGFHILISAVIILETERLIANFYFLLCWFFELSACHVIQHYDTSYMCSCTEKIKCMFKPKEVAAISFCVNVHLFSILAT